MDIKSSPAPTPFSPMDASPKIPSAFRSLWIGLLLFFIVFSLYWPSLHYGLVALDDIHYISHNQLVLSGLSWPAIRLAFADFHLQMYAPVLWISYMADVSIWGATPANPWGFHFTNVLLHALNSALLFLLLLAWRKKPWRAFFFAALWALHPLRIESVAWITERKDVLSGFFFLLCIGCYVLANTNRSRTQTGLYLASLVLFASGLWVKPSLTPIPIVLLLLDYWPLRRHEFNVQTLRRAGPRLLFEKIPFFLAAVAASAAAVKAHQASHSLSELPLADRLLDMPIHYGFYLFKVFRPRNLCPLYSPVAFSWPDFWLACAMLLLPTLWLWSLRRRHPHALVGWLWFLGLLLPVSGLIRFGAQVAADRFTYLPAIGLSIAGLSVFPSAIRRSWRKWLFPIRAILATGLLILLSARSLQTLPIWENSDALIARLSAYAPQHPLVLIDRAVQDVVRTGDFESAQTALETALLLSPHDMGTITRIALCINERQSPDAAMDFLLQHPPDAPTNGEWELQMATFAFLAAHYDKALGYVEQARNRMPQNDTGQNNLLLLGMAAAYEKGDIPKSLAYARQCPLYRNRTEIQLEDLLPLHSFHWGIYLRREALTYFRRLVQAYPARGDLLNNVAWFLATAEWSPAPPQEAIEIAQRALSLAPNPQPILLDTLAVAYANASDFETAIETTQQALALTPENPQNVVFRQKMRSRIALYQHQKPYREEASARLF
jgi:tetratricopeptide (TPR) repeat protein